MRGEGGWRYESLSSSAVSCLKVNSPLLSYHGLLEATYGTLAYGHGKGMFRVRESDGCRNENLTHLYLLISLLEGINGIFAFGHGKGMFMVRKAGGCRSEKCLHPNFFLYEPN